MSEVRWPGYRVIDRLESGAIADVYRAVQVSLGRQVLIKALSPSLLPSSPLAATLEREARLLAQLDHPALLELHDFVREPDSMWLVLESVQGQRLDRVLGADARLPPWTAAALCLALARALEHLHANDVVHRALSPRRVLLADDGRVKLFDLAPAASLTVAADASDLVESDLDTKLETLGYRSPEQVLGEPPDARSDLFCVGVLLYRCLAGELPFSGPDQRSVSQQIRHDPPAPLARRAPDVPPALERIVMRCLQKLPGDRFATSSELALVLEAALRDRGIDTSAEALQRRLAELVLSGARVADPEVPAATGVSSEPVQSGPDANARGVLKRSPVVGLALCFLAIILGGAALEFADVGAPAGGSPIAANGLELAPEHAGYLRVVAEPWAHVWVDGVHVETTPFARPIPLQAGRHYVRLEHPAAPTQRRDVELAPGETVLLDVKLDVPRAAVPPAPLARSSASSDAGPDAPAPSP